MTVESQLVGEFELLVCEHFLIHWPGPQVFLRDPYSVHSFYISVSIIASAAGHSHIHLYADKTIFSIFGPIPYLQPSLPANRSCSPTFILNSMFDPPLRSTTDSLWTSLEASTWIKTCWLSPSHLSFKLPGLVLCNEPSSLQSVLILPSLITLIWSMFLPPTTGRDSLVFMWTHFWERFRLYRKRLRN